MGDLAKQVQDGEVCQECGDEMDGEGYPQTCVGCLEEQLLEAIAKQEESRG